MADDLVIDAVDDERSDRATRAASDEQLVAQARHDRQAFAPLYQRYADPVYRFARIRLGSDAAAEDVVADTMLSVMEHLDRFDPARGTFAAWLFTIAARRITDHLRRHGRRSRIMSQVPYEVDAMQDDALETLIRRDNAQHLWLALTKLSSQDQELILLRYGTELSSVEIGAVLDIPPSTVRVRVMRARRRLAGDLGGER